MRSFSFYHASRSVLNSSLSGIDIRYLSANGTPEWSPRGADTWSPFSGLPYYLIAQNYSGNNAIYYDESGFHCNVPLSLYSGGAWVYNADLPSFISEWKCYGNDGQGATNYITFAKDGYYDIYAANLNASVGYTWYLKHIHKNVGDVWSQYIKGWTPFIVMYLGETNPYS